MQWALFEGLPDEEVREVLTIARRRRFGRGEVVFHQDDPADTLHLVAKGRFAVRALAPLGDAVVLTVLGPGESFGELALVSPDGRRSAKVDALEPAETLSVHRMDFDRLRARRPEVGDVLVGILAAQVRRLSTHLMEALYVPADKRVRRRLLDMARLYGEAGEPTGATVPLRQEELAGLAGTSRATVNKVLREEEERQAVELARGRTVVLDPDALERRAR
ncbi:MAG: Crp/Fnr family transcriptional regulator [Solirubrobacterales bacterium]|nr:Crp/Fnr family transcriptional regulator [Solirubrobacterales bacterium]